MVKTLFIITILLISNRVHALRQLPLIDHQKSVVEISNSEMTRIALKEDRIKQIFGVESDLTVEVDEVTGQIFLRPMGSIHRDHINLTIITEKGLTHDLKLIPKAKEADTILFYQALEEPATHEVTSRASRINQIADLIRQMSEQTNSSVGCSQHPLKLNSSKRDYGPDLHVELIEVVSQGSWEGLIYTIRNISSAQQYLHLECLAQKGDRALALLNNSLAPKEVTRLLVVREHSKTSKSKRLS